MIGRPFDAKYLRSIIHYDPDTGVVTRTVKTAARSRVGYQCGANAVADEYLQLSVLGRAYRVHVLAWLYMTGEWPSEQVDHIDGEKKNNRWNNLRRASPAINTQNRRSARSDSSTGVLGVMPAQSTGRYCAQIKVGGKSIHLGTFDTAELAHAAYVAAKRELHPGSTL